jgi:hypothetical protein
VPSMVGVDVPGHNPTAGLTGLLYRMEVEHPWLAQATAYCWLALEAALPDDAHALAEVLVFLEYVPDQDRATALVPAVEAQLPKAMWFRADPDDEGYGVTPLHRTDSRQPMVAAVLRRARRGSSRPPERDQQSDGGWPITWEPPSLASTLE